MNQGASPQRWFGCSELMGKGTAFRGWIPVSQASLVYILNSRKARATLVRPYLRQGTKEPQLPSLCVCWLPPVSDPD